MSAKLGNTYFYVNFTAGKPSVKLLLQTAVTVGYDFCSKPRLRLRYGSHHSPSLEQHPVAETVLSLRRGAVLCLKCNPEIIVNEHFDRRLYKDCNDYLTR
jgi:hypothetical protein